MSNRRDLGHPTLWKRTFVLTTVLLGASILWVGGICLASVLVVGAALPAGTTTPATAAPKPASSEAPSRTSPPPGGNLPGKNRNG